jgi:hypothetical protein
LAGGQFKLPNFCLGWAAGEYWRVLGKKPGKLSQILNSGGQKELV